jgi:hypothetical protein
MRHATARPEHQSLPNTLTQIIDASRSAIRSAVLAPSDTAALNVAGEALSHIATLARGDQSSSRLPTPTATAFQRLHLLFALIEQSIQSGDIERAGALGLITAGQQICRVHGQTAEVNHG